MKLTLQARAAVALLVLAPGIAAGAGSARPEFGFDAKAGYRYDSNVNIAEIDTSTGKSDTALVLDLGIDSSLPIGSRLTLNLGYAYSDTDYRNLSAFDLAIHHVRGELGWRLPWFESTLSVDRFDANLGGDGFLEITRVSPSLSRMVGNRLYLRGAWARSEKSHEESTERNAINEGLRADAYVLIDGMQRYLALTLQRDDEDAVVDGLDYDALSAKLAYGHRLEAGTWPLDLKVHVQIENRDYWAAPDAGEAPRRDERFRTGFTAALPLPKHFELTAQVEFADNASNVATAVYDELVFTVNVGAGF